MSNPRFMPRLRLAVQLAGLACLPALALAAPTSDEVAVVGLRQDEAAVMALVARAGGVVVRGVGSNIVVVVRSDQPGFVWRLYREGAWLVLNPLVAGGCVVAERDNHDRNA